MEVAVAAATATAAASSRNDAALQAAMAASSQAMSKLREYKLQCTRLEDENRALKAKLNLD